MRSIASAFALLAASLALSQQSGIGTKPDLVVRPTQISGGVGTWDLVQMVVALAIVFALLKWALPKLVTRMNKRLSAKDGSSITVEESASFGGGSLQIVTARGRTLLLCVSQSCVTLLADLTSDKPVQEEPAFFEMVDKASAKVVDEKDRVALERLNRLTG
jgi:flagellar biogenesis protein FliO